MRKSVNSLHSNACDDVTDFEICKFDENRKY